jgi:hypothetical protein
MDPERNKIIYVTADSSQWVVINIPFGMITPPTIELHIPLKGGVTFYYADCYPSLHIPSEAKRV